jgi:hypothetical protein
VVKDFRARTPAYMPRQFMEWAAGYFEVFHVDQSFAWQARERYLGFCLEIENKHNNFTHPGFPFDVHFNPVFPSLD